MTTREPAAALVRDVLLYVLARLAMVAVVAVVLALVGVPLPVALALGLVVALPLSLLVLRGLRGRVAVGLAERAERRRTQRDRLRAELRGEAEPPPAA